MKDSWSHGDDRRERGRVVDRGVTRHRRSRSPTTRRQDSDRDSKGRDRVAGTHDRPPRDRSPPRRRRASRSPARDSIRDSRDDVRERNKGRELLDDTRGSDKPKRTAQHSPSGKRRKTRSPSPSRSHHKRSRRGSSRSPRPDRPSSRHDKKRRPSSPPQPRRRSLERQELRGDIGHRHHRESVVSDRRRRSPSPKHHSRNTSRQQEHHGSNSNHKRNQSPKHHSARGSKPREASPFRDDRRRDRSPANRGRNSPDIDSYVPNNRSRQTSPRPSRAPEGSRGPSPRRDRGGRAPPGDDYRSDQRPDRPSGKSRGKSGRGPVAASGANSIEVKSDRMADRGFYGGQQGYNPNPMQAAFPLKPQYQPPQVDPRQYSQSPQHHHMTPNSYHSSPHAQQSPYNSGRGSWGGQQQYSHSPQPYQQSHQQSGYTPPAAQNAQFYGHQSHSQSPPYPAVPTGPMNQSYPPQQNFRGRGGYRGNNGFSIRGRGGDHRGGRGGHFQNLHWNAGGGAGRGQHSHSGNVTPQHVSPQPQPQPQTQFPPSQEPPLQQSQPVPVVVGEAEEEEDSEDLFRPSKELQVEDKDEAKNKDEPKKRNEEKMPPPSRPPPTGPQSQNAPKGFSFAFKASSKATPTAPKPEISQKLNAAPSRPSVQTSTDRPRGPSSSRSIPTEPASARRQDFREPPPPKQPAKRMIKKIMKREIAPPQLSEEFKASASVYYRRPGNESVVGSGTYGKVFRAIHVYTKDMVALKKIRMEGERDGFPVTAIREIKLLQSLKHKNIVNMQEVMVEKNDCFMVFEYLSHDLTGLLNHPSFKLDPAHKKHLAKQLFEGLDYLHRRGVLHRDIKAANILVSNEGLLKIADFGLARFYAKRRQLDYTNRVITIWYRSPELLLGETQYGQAVDIWSAACVLVEIFTRHAIFPGDGGEISQLEKIYAVLGTPNKSDWPGLVDMAWFELLRPTARRPNVFAEKYRERVTPSAFELLEAMFQYDPAKRPSASDVLEHPYFTVEEPKPRQAMELSKLEGDWHEFESKALRKENERKDKEARRQAQKETALKADKDKKRGADEPLPDREAKRVHSGNGPPMAETAKSKEPAR